MTKYIASIDQGTTSTRCMIFNHRGEPVGLYQLEHKQIYPCPGWVEHDPLEIWRNTTVVVREALRKSGATAMDIAAVGITNQRETTLVWDKFSGQPLYHAIVWQDTRTDKITHQLAEDGGMDRFRDKTGLPLTTYFSGPKIKWLLDNVEGLRTTAEEGRAVFGNIDTWLIWNLTGGVNGGKHVTDVTNASRTMLMNLETLDWDEDILNLRGIPRVMLPRICSSSEVYAHVRGQWEGIPLAGDLGDQQAALFARFADMPPLEIARIGDDRPVDHPRAGSSGPAPSRKRAVPAPADRGIFRTGRPAGHTG